MVIKNCEDKYTYLFRVTKGLKTINAKTTTFSAVSYTHLELGGRERFYLQFQTTHNTSGYDLLNNSLVFLKDN